VLTSSRPAEGRVRGAGSLLWSLWRAPSTSLPRSWRVTFGKQPLGHSSLVPKPTYDETAAALKISLATVHRELKLAKAWLRRELTRSA